MARYDASDIPDEAIRLRSYLIWKREGCPHDKALDHWLRAKAELESELRDTSPLRKPTPFVMPRVPISTPPRKSVSARVHLERRPVAAKA
jgi:hypothetical protein